MFLQLGYYFTKAGELNILYFLTCNSCSWKASPKRKIYNLPSKTKQVLISQSPLSKLILLSINLIITIKKHTNKTHRMTVRQHWANNRNREISDLWASRRWSSPLAWRPSRTRRIGPGRYRIHRRDGTWAQRDPPPRASELSKRRNPNFSNLLPNNNRGFRKEEFEIEIGKGPARVWEGDLWKDEKRKGEKWKLCCWAGWGVGS